MKRNSIICGTIMLIFIFSISCPLPEEPTVITIGIYSFLEPAYSAIFESENFKTAFPDVKIEIRMSDFDVHHENLYTHIQSGRGANDIEVIEISQLGRFISPGDLTDLSKDSFDGFNAGKDLTPVSLANATTEDGRLIALPVDIAPAVLFYRQSIADTCEVDVTYIADWIDYIIKATALTKDTNSDGIIDHYGVMHPKNPAIITLNGGKGNWFDEYGSPYQPESQFKNALQLALDIKDAEIDARIESFSDEWLNPLNEGKIVTYFSGAWMEYCLKSWCPDPAGDWRVTHLPVDFYASSGGSFLSIPQQIDNEKKELAWEIIKYICTYPDPQLLNLKTIGAFPVLTSVYNDPVMSEPDIYFGGQKVREIYRDIALQIPPQRVSGYDSLAMYIFNKAMDSVIAGEKTVDQAYSDAVIEILNNM